MTEPVARTSVRRTVRLAVALVVGQALLCAVIGWVTFGAGHAQGPGNAIPTADPLAAKPLVMPPPTAAPSSRPARSTSATPSAKPKSSTSAPESTRQPVAPSPPAANTTTAPIKRPTPPPGAPLPPALQLPSPAPDDVQSPVKLADVCDPVDAKGLTADGVSVHCVKGDDGVLRWQIN